MVSAREERFPNTDVRAPLLSPRASTCHFDRPPAPHPQTPRCARSTQPGTDVRHDLRARRLGSYPSTVSPFIARRFGALWAGIAPELELSSEAAALVSRVEDDFVALLALHAEEEGCFGSALDKSAWQTLVADENALTGTHWLLAYEGCECGWLSGGPAATEELFVSQLAKQDVRFYDPDAAWDPFSGPSGRQPRSTLGADIYP
jgi:hypothetical protein